MSTENKSDVENLCLRSICAHMRQLAALEFEPDEVCTPDAAATIAISTGHEEYVPFLLAHGASQATVDQARENKAAFARIRVTDVVIATSPARRHLKELVQTLRPMLDSFGELPNKRAKTERALDIFQVVAQYKDGLKTADGVKLYATVMAKIRAIIEQDADEADKPKFQALEAELAV